MRTWSFFDLASGVLTGREYSAPDDSGLSDNTPAGCGAVEEKGDPLCRRFDAITGTLMPYQPPAPADTLLETWTWNIDIERWESRPTLVAIKAAQWAGVKAERAAREFGSFTWGGSAFDSDPSSQSRIQGAAQLAQLALAAGQPFEIEWTLADNTHRTLSALDALAVGQALARHIGGLHAAARALRDLLAEATTAEEVAMVQWPA